MGEHTERAGDHPMGEATSSFGPMAPSADVLEIDHVYEALSHPRRRYICYTLFEDTAWSLTDLASKIAAWENDLPVQAVDPVHCEEVYVSLYHAHVPKLVDEGVVSFDAASETITPAVHAAQVMAAIDGIGGSLDAAQETHARGEIDDE